jgi:hypothetical protein
LAFKNHEIIDAEGGVGASKNGKNGAKTCQAFILFFSGTLCC